LNMNKLKNSEAKKGEDRGPTNRVIKRRHHTTKRKEGKSRDEQMQHCLQMEGGKGDVTTT